MRTELFSGAFWDGRLGARAFSGAIFGQFFGPFFGAFFGPFFGTFFFLPGSLLSFSRTVIGGWAPGTSLGVTWVLPGILEIIETVMAQLCHFLDLLSGVICRILLVIPAGLLKLFRGPPMWFVEHNLAF